MWALSGVFRLGQTRISPFLYDGKRAAARADQIVCGWSEDAAKRTISPSGHTVSPRRTSRMLKVVCDGGRPMRGRSNPAGVRPPDKRCLSFRHAENVFVGQAAETRCGRPRLRRSRQDPPRENRTIRRGFSPGPPPIARSALPGIAPDQGSSNSTRAPGLNFSRAMPSARPRPTGSAGRPLS